MATIIYIYLSLTYKLKAIITMRKLNSPLLGSPAQWRVAAGPLGCASGRLPSAFAPLDCSHPLNTRSHTGALLLRGDQALRCCSKVESRKDPSSNCGRRRVGVCVCVWSEGR